jgi:transcriptional regulator with XRE-family HTH domain
MTIREVLAANLKRYRRAAGLSQEELAHRAGIDRTYISSLERCQYAASIDVVDSLARELGVEAHVLLKPVSQKGRIADQA